MTTLSSGVWKKITIKRNHKTTTYAGGTDNSITYAEVWGLVQLGGGSEFFAAKKTNAALDGLVQLKQYVHGVGTDMEVYIDGLKYQIISVKAIREINFVELDIKKVS